MQVADVGIEADLFEGAVDGDAEQPVQERQQAVERVDWWPAGAGNRAVQAVGDRGEGGEVAACRGAFDPKQRVDVAGAGGLGEQVNVLLGCGAELGLAVASDVAGGSEKELPAVVELAGHHVLGDGQATLRIAVGLVLGLAEQRVARGRAAQARPEAAEPGQPAHGAAVVGAAQQQLIGGGDAAEQHYVVDASQRQDLAAGPVGVNDADGVAV